jgi:ankyrin repeat protein
MNTRQGREDENPMFSNSIDRLKESFLYATAQGGNAQDCESLLSIGADVNWKGQDGATPLLAACKRGHKEAAAVLLVSNLHHLVCVPIEGLFILHLHPSI